jgi:glutamyl-Q tRNA(Asp) synthetase
MPSPAPRSRVAWRVAVDDTTIGFVDRLQGQQQQALAPEAGDFVARRSDGLYAYQLAIVVDDGDDAITDIVRGADLIASTPRQIYLQHQLGIATPRYLHVPVALDGEGAKLSKSSGAAALAGDPLQALLGAWRFLGQSALPAEPASVGEFWTFALPAWTPRLLPRVPMLAAPPAFGNRRARPAPR